MIKQFKLFILSLPPEFLVSGIVISIIAFFGFLHFIRKEEKEAIQHTVSNLLTNKKSIESYADKIKNEIKPDTFFYKKYLSATLKFVENYLGTLKVFSFRTLKRHFTLSLIYSFLFFYTVWLFGGEGKIGNFILLLNKNRLEISLYLIFEIIIFFLLFEKHRKLIYFWARKFPLFPHFSNTWQELIVDFTNFMVIMAVNVFVLKESLVVGEGFALVGLLMETMVVMIMIGPVIKGGIIVLPALFVAGVAITNTIGAGKVSITSIVTLLFILILPFINSIFDYLSMYFSRKYAYKILETHKKWKIFVDIFIDTLIAIALLILLATTLFYLLEYTNHFIDDEKLKLPIEYYKTTLLHNPFDKDVLWITFMFASTLVPTFAHVILGLYSFLALKVTKPHLEKLTNEMMGLSKESKNDFLKYEVAKEIVLHEQSTMRIIYYLMAIFIFCFLIVTFIALLLKIGIPLF